MERYKCTGNRNQIGIEPICVDDMLPEESEVRAIDIIVERMDITSMDFIVV